MKTKDVWEILDKYRQRYGIAAGKKFLRQLSYAKKQYPKNINKAINKALKSTTNWIKGIYDYHKTTAKSPRAIAKKIEKVYQKAITVKGAKQLKYRKKLETLKLRQLQSQRKHSKNPEYKLRKLDQEIDYRRNLAIDKAEGRYRPLNWFRDSYVVNNTINMSLNEFIEIYGEDAVNRLQPLAQGSQYGYIDQETGTVISPT